MYTQNHKAKVLSVDFYHQDLFELKIENTGIKYDVGDGIILIHPENPIVSRAYSLCSSPSEDSLSFLIRRFEDGLFSNYLSNLKNGDEIDVGTKYHWNISTSAKKIFIATGTGISPFISYLKTYGHLNVFEIWYGVSREVDLVGKDLIEKDNFENYKYFISKENVKTNDRIFDRNFSNYLNKLPISNEIEYYICGSYQMIMGISTYLESQKISKDKIINETFF